MSETTSARDGPIFRHPAAVSGLERSRSALYARRTRAHHRVGAVPARRAAAEAIGPQLLATIRADLRAVPRSTAKAIARSTHGFGSWMGIRVARTRVLRVMRAHGLLSRTAGVQGTAKTHRREGHHPGAQRDVGDGRRARIHARRRMGLDLRGGRTLERGVCGVGTCAKSGAASRHSIRLRRARTSLWLAGRRRRPRAGASDGSRQSVPVRPFPQADPVLGDPPPASALSRNRKRTGWRSGGIVLLKEQAIHGRIFQNLEAARAALADFVER